jgi:uncharacterized protein (DUF4415 family)
MKTPTKRPISLRLDPDVLAAHRATGKIVASEDE